MPTEDEAWTSDCFAEDLAAVMAEFNVKRPILLGWSVVSSFILGHKLLTFSSFRSYGCTPAVDVVQKFGPHYLRALIYVGGLPFTQANHIVTDWQRNSIRRLLKQPNPDAYQNALHENVINAFLKPEVIPKEVIETWVKVRSAQTIEVYRQVLRRQQNTSRLWEEGGTVLPILIIHGQSDQICDHDASINDAKKHFKKVDVESWPGVGHMPHVERITEFNRVVGSWVEKVL